eukprot:11376-Eustigmatos_ZCMA.PRE.1
MYGVQVVQAQRPPAAGIEDHATHFSVFVVHHGGGGLDGVGVIGGVQTHLPVGSARLAENGVLAVRAYVTHRHVQPQ